MVCTPHQILFERSHKNSRGAEHVARTEERRGEERYMQDFSRKIQWKDTNWKT